MRATAAALYVVINTFYQTAVMYPFISLKLTSNEGSGQINQLLKTYLHSTASGKEEVHNVINGSVPNETTCNTC